MRTHIPGCWIAAWRPLCLVLLLSLLLLAHAQEEGDTGAHAVPPPAQTVYENPPGSGGADVLLDGRDSHSHYFNPRTGRNALVVSYSWRDMGTDEVLSEDAFARVRLNAGSTVIALTVVDEVGDEDTDYTEVMVKATQGVRPGLLMYLYNKPVKRQFETSFPRPFEALAVDSLEYGGIDDFPGVYKDVAEGGVRVVGRFKASASGVHSFHVDYGGGACTLFVNNSKVGSGVSTENGATARLSHGIGLAAGKSYNIEVLLERRVDFQKLALRYAPPNGVERPLSAAVMERDPQRVIVLRSMTPASGSIDGKYRITLKATGLNGAGTPLVRFMTDTGEKLQLRQLRVNAATAEITGIVPRFPAAGVKRVEVGSEFKGKSNPLFFEVTKAPGFGNKPGENIPVKFRELYPKNADGSNFEPAAITSIAYGPDGRFYMGSQAGFMIVFSLSRKYVITEQCQTDALYPGESILGLAFNPRDRYTAFSATVYMTLSTLFHDGKAWDNGRVEMWRSGVGEACLTKVKTLITGLPVSVKDHGVNKLQFDNAGSLYITVGGFTNGGVPHFRFGKLDETPLSAAVLKAPIWDASFDGDVKYDQMTDCLTSRQVSGDVDVYASGLRNSFGLLFHGNGKLYATDNSLNLAFGDISTGCDSFDPAPGNLPDRLFRIEEGEYYGHANRNRGECKWEYDRGQLANLKSSSPGILEYTACTFGGKLVGNLMISRYSNQYPGQLVRFQLSPSGNTLEGGEIVTARVSGLDIAQGPFGELLMPKVKQNKLVILVPNEADAEAEAGPVVVTVHPRRGPRSGGNLLRISGSNLSEVIRVEVGNKPCTSLSVVDDQLLTCRAPVGSGKVKVTASTGEAISVSYVGQYIYMTR